MYAHLVIAHVTRSGQAQIVAIRPTARATCRRKVSTAPAMACASMEIALAIFVGVGSIALLRDVSTPAAIMDSDTTEPANDS